MYNVPLCSLVCSDWFVSLDGTQTLSTVVKEVEKIQQPYSYHPIAEKLPAMIHKQLRNHFQANTDLSSMIKT